MANSSHSDFLGSASARFLDELLVLSVLLASHNPKNSSAILEFASLMDGAESALDSANLPRVVDFSLGVKGDSSFCKSKKKQKL